MGGLKLKGFSEIYYEFTLWRLFSLIQRYLFKKNLVNL